MSPADGSDFPPEATGGARLLPQLQAVLLRGGSAILLVEGAEACLPSEGLLVQEGAAAPWRAHAWAEPGDGPARWSAVAFVDRPPSGACEIRAACGRERWRLPAAPQLDVTPDPLAALVRRAGPAARGAIDFVVGRLAACDHEDGPERRARHAFARAFVAASAEPDGFVELIGAPDTGGLFVQGWSMSLRPGPATLVAPAAGAVACDVEVAAFARDDLLAPATGVCLFGKFWREDDPAALEAVFFEKDGRLLRLDVVRGAPALAGPAASAHVAQMLPRLDAPGPTRAAFRRVCRPRFAGEDTLAGTALPVAAAVDLALRAPDGGLLVAGWLLDPLRRVERALLKSTARLYHRLDSAWQALPRPDLVAGFAADPRFAGLLDTRDAMHGFVVHAPAPPAATDGAEVYLELVLDDGACLFRPVTLAPFDGPERLPAALAAVAPAEPELGRIVEDHLAPFLAGVPPRAPRRAAARTRPLPLGDGLAGRATAALVPFRSFAELQPLLALLAGGPEARALDLALVAPRGLVSEAAPRLEAAFEFYGLSGALVLAGDGDGTAAQLDLAAAAAAAPELLAWSPAALPKGPGWLARLRAEAAALPAPGLLSPALTYEDGSIFFGGAGREAAGAACALSGYGAAAWLPRGAPRRTPAGAAQAALLPRAALEAAGGFAGPVFGDAFVHLDLAERLDRAGFAAWCSGAVEFWLLDDHAPEPAGAARVLRRIDAALLARRGRPVRERDA
jgi:hypothetical protein